MIFEMKSVLVDAQRYKRVAQMSVSRIYEGRSTIIPLHPVYFENIYLLQYGSVIHITNVFVTEKKKETKKKKKKEEKKHKKHSSGSGSEFLDVPFTEK